MKVPEKGAFLAVYIYHSDTIKHCTQIVHTHTRQTTLLHPPLMQGNGVGLQCPPTLLYLPFYNTTGKPYASYS